MNMMQVRKVLLAAVLGGSVTVAIAQAPGSATKITANAELWLVLPQEAVDFQGQAGFDEPPALRPRTLNPAIDLIRPTPGADGKLASPFPIQVTFRGMSDAEIDPATFRVFYGALKIDITERIAGHVKITPAGFSLDQAKIPKGKHRLTLQIQDKKQRVAERELRIEVD
jgi:hypothetical protein